MTRQSDVSTGGEASISLKHQEVHLGGDFQSFGQSWLKSSAPFKPNSEKLASPSPMVDRMKENKDESTSYSMERFSKDSLDGKFSLLSLNSTTSYTFISSTDSSVGRAVDCRGVAIHRSLVRIRLGGFFFPFFFSSNARRCWSPVQSSLYFKK